MKARCKKELRFPNFTFEVDKKYDFEVEVVYLPAEESDVVLARGCRTRHLQYSTEIEVVPDISVCQEKMSITVHFYDRQYCVRNNWRTPGVKLVGLLPGGELYCFEDFFVEEFDRSGRVWYPNDWSDLKPINIDPWVKEELAKTIESVMGDKAEERVIMPTNMPTRMDLERWKHDMMCYPRPPKVIKMPVNKLKDLCDYLIRSGYTEPIDIEDMKEYGITIKVK